MSTNEDLLRRLDALESEGAIRRLMAEYLTVRDFEEEKVQPMTINGQAHWVAGRYFNAFARVDGQWKFKHIRIEGIFSSPYEDGWAKTPALSS